MWLDRVNVPQVTKGSPRQFENASVAYSDMSAILYQPIVKKVSPMLVQIV